MLEFVLSAFADEYSPEFDRQLEGLKLHGIGLIEVRGVDRKNISNLTDEELHAVRAKLDAAGIGVSAIGSPVGKIKVFDPFEPELEKLKRCISAAKILGTKNIRMFSFYIPSDKTYEECRDEVMKRLGIMLETAEAEGITLCHENEKGIYGDNDERCYEIQKEFGGRIKLIFDPANFREKDVETFPKAYGLLKDYIYYMHIKDVSSKDKTIVPAGRGDGRIPEILSALNASRSGRMILTIEPHLKVFDGLANLESDEKTNISGAFKTSEEAFGAAVKAIKDIIAKIG